ncbi:lipoprotein [Spiroplasma endosymbiont of Stenodema calcarata]|uniref:lipoprotein n=1 Tax=Spiroplasma endosymbiont of Stenodema calcarata TaxID=3139328 RepID=UPI003CCAFA51
MKKLLSLLGVFSLTVTSATAVVSCKPNSKEEPDDNSQHTNILLELKQKAESKIKNLLKSYLYFDSKQNPLLANLYNKVNENDQNYELTAAVDHEYIVFFNQILQKVVIVVNADLREEYSNYYLNSVPITLENEKINGRVNYVDLAKIKTQFPAADISDLQAVGILFSAIITIQFKNLTSHAWIGDKFEVTNNVPLYQSVQKLVSHNVLNVLQKNIFNTIKAIVLDKDTKYFKELYDEFNINYSKDNSVLGQKLQDYFDSVIKGNAELQPYQMTFNDNVDVITTISTEFDNFQISDNKAGVVFFKYLNGKNIFEISEAQATDFVEYYQTEILPDFKIEDNNIVLGQFKINLEYFNILGLKLVNNDSEQNNINILISKPGFTTKLNNFGNLIINYFV